VATEINLKVNVDETALKQKVQTFQSLKTELRAIKGELPQARSNFPDYAGPLTETILLGNLAVWAAPDADTPKQS